MRVQFRTRVPPQCPRKSSVHEGLDDRRWRSAAVVPAQKLGWREASSSMKIAVALLAATEARNRKLVAQMPSILCACLSALGTRVALSECRTPAGTYCHSSAGPTARSTTSERRPCCSASKRQCSRRPPGSRVWARAGMASWQAFGGGGGGGQGLGRHFCPRFLGRARAMALPISGVQGSAARCAGGDGGDELGEGGAQARLARRAGRDQGSAAVHSPVVGGGASRDRQGFGERWTAEAAAIQMGVSPAEAARRGGQAGLSLHVGRRPRALAAVVA
mmetsp:Transcript_27336/g.89662  ORF Transcript_27336/g.89662 Transcript_27336/m.89662 type:complete len:276 (-) Transcript_27336:119-946(-)